MGTQNKADKLTADAGEMDPRALIVRMREDLASLHRWAEEGIIALTAEISRLSVENARLKRTVTEQRERLETIMRADAVTPRRLQPRETEEATKDEDDTFTGPTGRLGGMFR
jgi:hypothetical protein